MILGSYDDLYIVSRSHTATPESSKENSPESSPENSPESSQHVSPQSTFPNDRLHNPDV
jgi:hypothetical protein